MTRTPTASSSQATLRVGLRPVRSTSTSADLQRARRRARRRPTRWEAPWDLLPGPATPRVPGRCRSPRLLPATGASRPSIPATRTTRASSDASTDECFDVTSASTSTTTTPTSSTGALGGPNSDVAVVTGNAAGGSPTGTVSFYECGPTATPTACTSKANPVGVAEGLDSGGR